MHFNICVFRCLAIGLMMVPALGVFTPAHAQEGTARPIFNSTAEMQMMQIVPVCAPGTPVVVSGSRLACSTMGCMEPAWLVSCMWNWSGSGNDTTVFVEPISVNPLTACQNKGSHGNYIRHTQIMRPCAANISQWSTGAWGTCTARCTNGRAVPGVQTRVVRCVDGNGSTVPANRCNAASRPLDQQACSTFCFNGGGSNR